MVIRVNGKYRMLGLKSETIVYLVVFQVAAPRPVVMYLKIPDKITVEKNVL